MDILAHALWTGVCLAAVRRRWPVAGDSVAKGCEAGTGEVAGAVSVAVASAAVAMSVLPDLLHNLPVLAWVAVGDGTLAQGVAYAVATPATEPLLPPWVKLWSHHLHCLMHSVLVAAAATAMVWRWQRLMWLPLLSWWLHIVIDVFTHSTEFYPVPLFYPITMRGFGVVAWNTPWFAALNYAALTVVVAWLWLTRQKTEVAANDSNSIN